jgi:hypothetical protein
LTYFNLIINISSTVSVDEHLLAVLEHQHNPPSRAISARTTSRPASQRRAAHV